MSKKSLNKVMLFGALSLVIVGLLVASQLRPVAAFKPSPDPIAVLDQTDPSGVRYWAALGAGGGDVNIGVHYNYLDKSAVEAYIAWNKAQATRLLETQAAKFWVMVSFNGPQSRQAFEQFVKDYDMEVAGYTMRAIEPPTAAVPEGNRVTMVGAPEAGVLIPESLFNQAYSSVVDEHGATFKGWIMVRGGVAKEGLKRLLTDPRVAVVEIVESIGRQALRDNRARLVGANPRLLEALVADQPHPHIQLDGVGGTLYWQLEDFGLVPK